MRKWLLVNSIHADNYNGYISIMQIIIVEVKKIYFGFKFSTIWKNVKSIGFFF
jgi:hypothetical protein